MNKTSILLFLPFALAANAIFNPSFELGTDGFALEKELRPDTNPGMTFLPLKTAQGAPGAGKNSLKIENPYSEHFVLYSKEFKLKPATEYRLSAKVRASMKGEKLNFRVIKAYDQWLAYTKAADATTEWSDFEYVFSTDDFKEESWLHIQIFPVNREDAKPGDFYIDDLKLEETGKKETFSIDAIAAPDKHLYLNGETAKIALKLTNPGATALAESATVNVTDDYSGKPLFSEQINLRLAPGETKNIPLKPRKLERSGGFRVSVKGNSLRTHDSFFSVFGKYEAKPIDITKDFVVAFNGGLEYRMPPNSRKLSYRVYNAPLEKRFEFYAAAGCRILRDHDGGQRGVNWNAVEEKRGVFDFSHLDRQLAIYGANNITLFPVIGCGFIENRPDREQRWPKWVVPLSERVKDNPPNCMAGVRGKVLLPPRDLYRNYIYQTVKHIKGRVTVYEVTNEPNLYLAPEAYVAYLKEANSAIREADPAAKISGFCLSSDFSASATPWMDQCVKLGGLNYVDAVGFHPYGGRQLGALYPADKYIASLRADMKRYGKPDFPLWNTELYYLIDQQVKHDSYEEGLIRPHHIAMRFLIDLGEGVVQSISVHENQLWKRLLTPNNLGISNYHELVPSENMVAYNALARLFEAAEPVKKIRHDNGVICYVYRKGGNLIAAVWQYQKKKGVCADLSAFEVTDLFANPETADEKELGEAPFYLRPGKLSDSEFLAKLEKLPIRLDQPISAGEIARRIGNSLFVMLHNDSDVVRSGTAGVTGGGLSALKPLNFTLAPKAKQTFEIPVKDIAPNGKPLTLMLHVNKNLFRMPLQLTVNEIVPRNFKMQNAEGRIEFENGKIKLEMSVKDTTDAGATGRRSPWETDCTELFFDLAPEYLPAAHAQAYTPQTFRLFVTPRGTEKLHVMGAVKPDDCKLDVKQSADGYSFKLEIRAATGKMLGFDVKIDDAGNGKIRETTLGKGKELYRNRCNFSIVK